MRPTPERLREIRDINAYTSLDEEVPLKVLGELLSEIDALKAELESSNQNKSRIKKLREALEQYSSCKIDCQCAACRALAADDEEMK